MVGLATLFWLFVVIFAVIGMARGWAKELLVTFSVVLGIFIITLLEKFAPGFIKSITHHDQSSEFWLRFGIIVASVILGYQSPNLPRIAGSPRFIRNQGTDTLFGFFIGAINGFLIFGTIWFFLHQTNYALALVQAPVKGTALGDAALQLIPYLAPSWLAAPLVYFVAAIAFICVIVLFL
jgi:hypothetical protein